MSTIGTIYTVKKVIGFPVSSLFYSVLTSDEVHVRGKGLHLNDDVILEPAEVAVEPVGQPVIVVLFRRDAQQVGREFGEGRPPPSPLYPHHLPGVPAVHVGSLA
jgi:hypothetical protein